MYVREENDDELDIDDVDSEGDANSDMERSNGLSARPFSGDDDDHSGIDDNGGSGGGGGNDGVKIII